MIVKTNSIKNGIQNKLDETQFDPSRLMLKRCEILDSSSTSLVLRGTSTDGYHADYGIDGSMNKMKILSFSCRFHSTSNTAYVEVDTGKSQSEAELTYIYDEVTDLGKADICIPITEDYVEIRFGCYGNYSSICDATFTDICLSISENSIQVNNNGTLNYDFDWQNPSYTKARIPQGYTRGGEINVLFPNKQVKTVDPSTETVHVVPDEGKLLEEVWVNPISTQSKAVTPSTSNQTVNPDAGKLLSSVMVNAIPDSAYQYSGLTVRSATSVNGEVAESSVLNAGTNKYKVAVISCINASSCVLYGSDDQSTWKWIATIDNSTNSNNTSTNLNMNIAVYPNLTYRYYKVAVAGYTNGYRSSCGMAVARSSI